MSQDPIDHIVGSVLDPVTNFTKREGLAATKSTWQEFKHHIALATEHFFQVGMGQRHCNALHAAYGGLVWLATGFLSAYFFSSAPLLLVCLNALQIKIPHLLNQIIQVFNPAWIPGIFLFLLQIFYAAENERQRQIFFLNGVPHHSRSPGVARWKFPLFFILGMELFLLCFNWPLTFLFGFAIALNREVRHVRQNALYQNYWDAVDQKLERDYLEDCAMGLKPAAILWMYDAIDPNLSEAFRRDVTNSLVGKPIHSVARPPKVLTEAMEEQAARAKPSKHPRPPQEPYDESLILNPQTAPIIRWLVFPALGLIALVYLLALPQYVSHTAKDWWHKHFDNATNQSVAVQPDVATQTGLIQKQRQDEEKARARKSEINSLVDDFNAQQLQVNQFLTNVQTQLDENPGIINQKRFWSAFHYLDKNKEFVQQAVVVSKNQAQKILAIKAAIQNFESNPFVSYDQLKATIDNAYAAMKTERDDFEQKLAEFRKTI